MKLEKLGVIAEIAGAVAVVTTLIFVAIEVEQNTLSQDASTMQEVYRDLRTYLEDVPDEIRCKSRFTNQPLTRGEVSEYNQWLSMGLRMFENWHALNRLSVISDEIFASYMNHVEIMFRDQYARDYWRNDGGSQYFTKEFAEYINAFIEHNPAPERASEEQSCTL